MDTQELSIKVYDRGRFLVSSSREGDQVVDTATKPWCCSCENFGYDILPVLQKLKLPRPDQKYSCRHIDGLREALIEWATHHMPSCGKEPMPTGPSQHPSQAELAVPTS